MRLRTAASYVQSLDDALLGKSLWWTGTPFTEIGPAQSVELADFRDFPLQESQRHGDQEATR
jgi:hypothetical protein